VLYAPIASDGTVGTWTSAPATSNLTSPREDFGIGVYNGYIYIAGGDGDTTDLASVQYIPINADGSITAAWSNVAAGSLPDPNGDGFWGPRATVYNGYLYVTGAAFAPTNSRLYYVALSPNGDTTGSWSYTTFTDGRRQTGIVANNGYIYIMGGTDGSTLMADVQYAPINADGSVGTFKYTASLTNPRKNFSVTAQNGYIYVIGGYDSMRGNTLIDIQMSAVNSDGSLAGWTTSAPFGTPSAFLGSTNDGRYGTGAVIYNGYLYVTGGANDNRNYANTLMTQINTMPRIGTYSQLIDLGGAVALPTSLTYNGTLTPASSVTYQLASSDGVFSAPATAGSITPPSCQLATTNTRYIWVNATLDDSLTSSFSDTTAANASNITDITFNYNYGRPPANLRMHGGKYFAGNTQVPLDTCGL